MEHQQLGGDISEQAVTQFIELIRFLFSEIKPGGDPKAIFAFMQQALENPEALKRDLIAMVRTQDPEKIKSDALEISNGLRSPRKFVTGLIKDFIPAGRPGKRPQITEAKEQQMIQLG